MRELYLIGETLPERTFLGTKVVQLQGAQSVPMGQAFFSCLLRVLCRVPVLERKWKKRKKALRENTIPPPPPAFSLAFLLHFQNSFIASFDS